MRHRLLRRGVDVALVAAAVAASVAAVVADEGPPAMPAGVCDSSSADARARPRWEELTAGRQVSVAVVLARLDNDGAIESSQWSADRLREALRRRGFAPSADGAVAGERWVARQGRAVVEVIGPLPDDAARIDAALASAIAAHRVVYYHGHSHAGQLAGFADRPDIGHRLLVIDSCYSAQYYHGELARPTFDRLVNRARSVSGSIGSLVPVLDALLAAADGAEGPTWRALIDEMNARARVRAHDRVASRYPEPEAYGRAQRCATPGAAASR